MTSCSVYMQETSYSSHSDEANGFTLTFIHEGQDAAVTEWLFASCRGPCSAAHVSCGAQPYPAGNNTAHISSSFTFHFHCVVLLDYTWAPKLSRSTAGLLSSFCPKSNPCRDHFNSWETPPPPSLSLKIWSNVASGDFTSFLSAFQQSDFSALSGLDPPLELCKTSHVTKHWAD